MVVTFSLIHSGDSIQESKMIFTSFLLNELIFCPLLCVLQVDRAMCAAPSHQYALGSDCVGQHTEHFYQSILYQYWKVLWSSHHPSGKRWKLMEAHCGNDWLKQQLWHMNSGDRLHTNSAGREMIICILTICDYSVFIHLSCNLSCWNI